jgi:hypothetical protein
MFWGWQSGLSYRMQSPEFKAQDYKKKFYALTHAILLASLRWILRSRMTRRLKFITLLSKAGVLIHPALRKRMSHFLNLC